MDEAARYRVFISHGRADSAAAREIASSLNAAGLSVWLDEWMLQPGDSWSEEMQTAMRASGVVLILLSATSARSKWLRYEVALATSNEFRDRAVLVLPALLSADCAVPESLQNRVFLNLYRDWDAGLTRLARRLGAASTVDLHALDGKAFETLALNLLTAMGFNLKTRGHADRGIDAIASYTYQSPLGQETDEWLVQVKHYRNARVGVEAIREFVTLLNEQSVWRRGLVVTTGQLTSVTREFAARMARQHDCQLRVLDGTQIRAHLVAHPEVLPTLGPRNA